MIVHTDLLLNDLQSDLMYAGDEIDEVTRQETALDDAILDLSVGTSHALDSFRTYLDSVRRPSVTALREYLCAFVQDMHEDQQRVMSDIFPLSATMLDTDRIEGSIETHMGAARRLDDLADGEYVLPEVAGWLRGLAESNRRAAYGLRDQLDRAMQYLTDGSLYGRSAALLPAIEAARSALGSVRISKGGTFDFSHVDLSWVVQRDSKYWRERNRQTIDCYLVLDEDGNFLGIRPEMASRYTYLALLGLRCLDTSGMPKEVDKLMDDEKYVILWVLAKAGPTILDMLQRNERERVANTGGNIAGRGISLFDAAEEHPLFRSWLKKHVTDKLSFTTDGDIFYSIDSPKSIQRANGFADVTELGGYLLGMDLDTHVTTFVHDGYEYRLQSWDGTYAAGLTYGGEVGLYRRKAPEGPSEAYEHMGADEIRSNIETLTGAQVRSAFITYECVPDDVQPDIDIEVHPAEKWEPLYGFIDNQIDNTYWSFNAKPIPVGASGRLLGGYTKENTFVKAKLTFLNNLEFTEEASEALLNEGLNAHCEVSDNVSSLYVTWER